MSASSAGASSTADRELVFTRVFDAPRELVFEAWTDPRHVEQWWGPNGFRTTISQMDVRPGGEWRLVMHGPDGRDYRNHIVFLEVVKPERLVYKHDPEKDSEPVRFEVTVTFAEDAGKTRLTMRMLFPSAAARDHVVKTYGAEEGGKQTLGRLAEHLPAFAIPELVITRTVDAPRPLVFEAWADPSRMKHWWGPDGFTNPVCEFDARPGGAMHIDMRAPDGTVYRNCGVFHEVAAPQRLVFSLGMVDPQGNIILEGVNTVTFTEQGGKTTITLRVRMVKATPQAMHHIAGMNEGWTQSLQHLARKVESKEHSS